MLGLDIGTTGARAVAFDVRGRQLHVSAGEYPLHTPRPGWAEQDPEQVYQSSTECLREIAIWSRQQGYHAVALGLSAAFHSLIPVDAAGRALDVSLIWADGRSVAEAAEIRSAVDPLALYHRTGAPVHPMYAPPKLRWLARHRADTFAQAASFVGIKEYVLRRWTGLHVCDRSVASGTGMYNMHAGTWDAEALAVAGISEGQLPALVEPTQPLDVPATSLRDLGLPPECVLVAGAGDGVLQTIGTGCVSPGQMVAMVATSGAVRSLIDRPRTDDQARTWCYYLAEGRWVAGAAINNAGLVYAWLRDVLQAAAQDASGARRTGSGTNAEVEPEVERRAQPPVQIEAADLDRWAAEVPAGSNGLLFLPYLAGERSPNWNADARGLLFGLSLAHDHRHLARATLEGVAYRMRTIFEPMEAVVGPVVEVRAAGGFTRSALWLQIVADVLGHALTLVASPEASSLGAAQLACRGASLVPRFEDLAPLVATAGSIRPHAERHAQYSRLYELYLRLYHQAGAEFGNIARFQDEQAVGGR